MFQYLFEFIPDLYVYTVHKLIIDIAMKLRFSINICILEAIIRSLTCRCKNADYFYGFPVFGVYFLALRNCFAN